MNYERITQEILHNFKIGRKYTGHDYILYGIHLMKQKEGKISHITKSIYIDIAGRFDTTSASVERCIRSTIEIMWRNQSCNMELLIRIFGQEHIAYRPTNTDFFELLYDYVKARSADAKAVRCPYSGCEYCVCKRRGQCGMEG